MKILSLNCQRGYTSGLQAFLRQKLTSEEYDFLLLQEFAKEVPSFVDGVASYAQLQMTSPDIDLPSQTCILYRSDYRLLERSYIPFAKMRRDPVMGTKHATFGSLFARFQTGSSIVLVGSVHLHSGIDRKVRRAQTEKVKEQAIALMQPDDVAIFGGDCNFGPGERARAERVFTPEFVCATRGLGPTLDSRYSENVPHLPNRIAHLFGFFGIGIPLRTDHLFVDRRTAEHASIKARVLADRVSDHSPVELEILG